MEQSILNSVKKVLSIDPEYTAFDLDIITHINSAFSVLQQLGVGPTIGFMIEDDVAVWSDFGTLEDPHLNLVKTCICLRVRMLFDPPTTSYLIGALEKQSQELEWRLNSMREESEWVHPDPGFLVVDGGDPTGEPGG
jgi:hypothetical protein